jgi:hypothetical protein
MSKEDDVKRAMEFAFGLLEKKPYPTTVPLGVLYDVGLTIIYLVHAIEHGEKDITLERELLRKLIEQIPQELIDVGAENFEGDLEANVTVPLTYSEVQCIGEEALALPSGKEVIDTIDVDPAERATFDALKNRHLLSALAIEEAYVAAGGRRNIALEARIGEQLS